MKPNCVQWPSQSIALTSLISAVVCTHLVPPLSAALNPIKETVPAGLATPAANYVFEVPVVVLRFFPTADGVNLDVTKAPDFWWLNHKTLAQVKAEIDQFTSRVKFMLEEGSKFRGYKDASARPSIGYRVVDSYTFYAHPPAGQRFWTTSKGLRSYFLNYAEIFSAINAEQYVNNLGVKEFWVWFGYYDSDFPSYDPAIHNHNQDSRALQESNMSSRLTGDISNSGRFPEDLPLYQKSYTVYEYNIRRTENEAVHNHGHQLEAILSYANRQQDGNEDLFWKKFVGQNSSGQFITGRCGWTHMPPNTTQHYDYFNTAAVLSDIEDWKPDNSGSKRLVNVNTWASLIYDWPDHQIPAQQKTGDQWFIYWMQSMPGYNNRIPHGNGVMVNWWEFTADWDSAITRKLGLYAIAPVITQQPQGQTVAAGAQVTLSVAVNDAAATIQWRKNGADLAGGTNSTYVIENAQSAHGGTYAVLVTNAAGSTTSSNAVLTVNVLPTISSQPQSQTVTVGAAVTFSVSAAGASALNYQWRKDGVNLEGATAASYTISNAQPSHAGAYSVLVTAAGGNVTSSAATLTVNAPPTITTQPQSQIMLAGTTVSLSVSANGTGPLNFQWRKDGVDIPGATAATHTIANAQTGHGGTYSAVVSSSIGTVTSGSAVLTIVDPAAPLQFTVGSMGGSKGSQIVVPIRVQNFGGIVNFQFSIHWNPEIASFKGVEQFGLDGLTSASFGGTEAAAGTLRVSWDDPGGIGKSLAHGTTVFAIRVELAGDVGSTSAVAIDGSPVIMEATRSVNGQLNAATLAAAPGEIIVRSTVQLAGQIHYYSLDKKVAGVIVDLLDGSGNQVTSTNTGSDGSYSFTVDAGTTRLIVPGKPEEHPPNQGVTTLDITLVRRHILGIAPLESPFKIIAADVNASSSVTTLDITLIRRVILGLSTNFGAGHWKFVRSGESFADPLAPWNYASSRSFTNLTTDAINLDFVGIRLGDVNGSWTPASAGAQTQPK